MKVNIDKLARCLYEDFRNDLTLEDIKFACCSIFDHIKKILKEDGRVEIRNFGSFSVRARKVPIDARLILDKEARVVRKNVNSIYFRMSKNIIEN